MWPRHAELFLGVWLALTPFVFRLSSESTSMWLLNLGGGLLVASASLAAHWPPLRRIRLVIPLFACFLIGISWAQSRPLSPVAQNHIVTGLLLLMASVCPSLASQPPPGWRKRSEDA